MNRFFKYVLAFSLLSTISLTATDNQDPFSTISYSARLSTSNALSLAGSAVVSMTAQLFEVEEGGNAGYIQVYPSVEVIDGFFSLSIGPSLPDMKKYQFLELEVQGQTMNPRRKFLTMPYAIEAMDSQNLAGMSPDEFRQNLFTGIGVTDSATSGVLKVGSLEGTTLIVHDKGSQIGRAHV